MGTELQNVESAAPNSTSVDGSWLPHGCRRAERSQPQLGSSAAAQGGVVVPGSAAWLSIRASYTVTQQKWKSFVSRNDELRALLQLTSFWALHHTAPCLKVAKQGKGEESKKRGGVSFLFQAPSEAAAQLELLPTPDSNRAAPSSLVHPCPRTQQQGGEKEPSPEGGTKDRRSTRKRSPMIKHRTQLRRAAGGTRQRMHL